MGQKNNLVSVNYYKISVAWLLIGVIMGYCRYPVIAAEAQSNRTGVVNSAGSANVGDDLPMSRALVAKMLAMTFGDQNSIDSLDRYIDFADTSPDFWYDKYINFVYVNGMMQGYGGLFMPEQPVTLVQAQLLLDKLDPDNNIKLQMTEQNKDMAISYALWTELFTKLLNNLRGDTSLTERFGIRERSIIVLATPGNNKRLGNFNLISDTGPMSFIGLKMDAYVDKQVRVLEKGGDVLAALTVVSHEPTIRNAFIVSNDNEKITVFSGGAERTYAYKGLDGDKSGKICDITIKAQAAAEVVIFDDRITDFVMSTTTDKIELKSKGIYEIGENFKVYSISEGPVYWRSLPDLIVGTDLAEYILKDGVICAAVITKKPQSDSLRVSINDTGFRSLYHIGVTMKGSVPVTVNYGSRTKTYSAGEQLIINSDFFTEGKRIYIAPEPGGIVEINSISRNWPDGGTPGYGGTFEISKEEGGYCIVNIIDMESYLYTVVPSEMPTGHGIEALKVQAITARSYAYNQFYENRFHKYGGNIDDSVSCQVYNNIPSNASSKEAVDSTKGIYLAFRSKIVSANFFSTSAGMTANGGEVWASSINKQFPTSSREYMRAVKQFSSDGFGDLRIEENAAKFFKSADIDSYDSKYSWFRWNTELTGQEIAASINANLKARYEANPLLIKTLYDGKFFRSSPIEKIGALVDIEIISRGEGGNIMSMKVTGTEATILVLTEYNIRALIRPNQYVSGGRDIILNLKDGTALKNYSIMPSAFYVIEKQKENGGGINTVKFYGGGMGHGVGMSQNGVKGMIDLGFGYVEILQHYYPGTELIRL